MLKATWLGTNRSNLGSFSVSKYGTQQSTDPYNSTWGNGVHTNGSYVTGNTPADAYVAKPAGSAELRAAVAVTPAERAVRHRPPNERPVSPSPLRNPEPAVEMKATP